METSDDDGAGPPSIPVKALLEYRRLDSFTFGEKDEVLGSGSFGKVVKAHHPDYNDVAIKILYCGNEATREAIKMRKLSVYPSIINVFCIAIDDNKRVGIVMEWMKLGNLKKFQQNLVKNIPWPLRMRMLKEISEGMYFLHHVQKPEIIHGDLKAENIFVQESLSVKIGDLGLSWSMQSIDERPQNTGTPSHMPPEYFSDIKQAPSPKWDVYSFAITQWEIGTGKTVYEELSGSVDRLKWFLILNKRPELTDLSPGCPTVFKELMEECWHEEPDKRPDFRDIKSKIHIAYQKDFDRDVHTAIAKCQQQLSQDQNTTELDKDSKRQTSGLKINASAEYGTRNVASVEHGTSSSASVECGTPSSASVECGTPSSASVEHSTPSSASFEHVTPSSASVERGTPSLPSIECGTPSSASFKRGTPSSASFEHGTPSSASAEYVTSSSASGECGTSSSAFVECGTSSLVFVECGTLSSTSFEHVTPSSASAQYITPSLPSLEHGTPSSVSFEHGTPSSASAEFVTSSSASVERGTSSLASVERGTSSLASARCVTQNSAPTECIPSSSASTLFTTSHLASAESSIETSSGINSARPSTSTRLPGIQRLTSQLTGTLAPSSNSMSGMPLTSEQAYHGTMCTNTTRNSTPNVYLNPDNHFPRKGIQQLSHDPNGNKRDDRIITDSNFNPSFYQSVHHYSGYANQENQKPFYNAYEGKKLYYNSRPYMPPIAQHPSLPSYNAIQKQGYGYHYNTQDHRRFPEATTAYANQFEERNYDHHRQIPHGQFYTGKKKIVQETPTIQYGSRFITNADIKCIKKHFKSAKFRDLGREFKLEEGEIDSVEEDNHFYEERLHQLILKWQQKHGKKTRSDIVKCLCEVDQRNVIDELNKLQLE